MAEDQTPDLTMDGVDLDDCLLLNDGEEIVNGLVQMFQTQQFENFTVEMESGEETYECECRAAGTFKRGDRYRLYLVVNNPSDDLLYTLYLVQSDDGQYYMVDERDDEMLETVKRHFTGEGYEEESKSEASDKGDAEEASAAAATDPSVSAAPTAKAAKEKGGGGKKAGWIILTILLLPLWILWEFIKALLSLINIGIGHSPMVRAFKRGYSGESQGAKEYTFTNDMGCTQTVYSYDGKTFYNADGSYAGRSDDGKTIHK